MQLKASAIIAKAKLRGVNILTKKNEKPTVIFDLLLAERDEIYEQVNAVFAP